MRWALLVVVAACGRAHFDPLAGDAGVDGALGPPSCIDPEHVGPLTTDFNTGLPSFAQLSAPPPTMDIADGQLRGIPIMAAGNNYAELSTLAGAFVSRRSFVQVPRMVNTDGCAQVSMIIIKDDFTDYVELSQTCNELVAQSWTANAGTMIGSAPYDPVAHRWWQIRSQLTPSATVSFETSPDGATWTSIGSMPTPSYFSSAVLELAVGTYQLETLPPGEARFDDLTDCQTVVSN